MKNEVGWKLLRFSYYDKCDESLVIAFSHLVDCKL